MKRNIRPLAAIAALVFMANVCAPAAEVVLSLAHATAEVSALHIGSLAMKKYLEEKSGGRIQVNIFANAQLGGDREELEGVQEGSIDIMVSNPAPHVNFISSAAIFDLAFAQSTIDDIFKTHSNPAVLAALRKQYEKGGFYILGINNCGFRVTTSNKPINSPKDLVGVSVRTMENRNHIALWRSLGANPTPIAFNELYTALQQKVVDGQENPLELIWSQKFYEQQSYVIKTNHLPQTLLWIMGKKRYDALPADLKKIVDDGAAVTLKAASDYVFNNNAMYEKELAAKGVKFIELTPEQLAPFKEKVTDEWDLVKKSVDPEVYDAYVNALK